MHAWDVWTTSFLWGNALNRFRDMPGLFAKTNNRLSSMPSAVVMEVSYNVSICLQASDILFICFFFWLVICLVIYKMDEAGYKFRHFTFHFTFHFKP